MRPVRIANLPDGGNDLREVHHFAADVVLCHVPDGITRCGISAKQIQRETGVTYKTAWRMFRQIRSLLSGELRLEGRRSRWTKHISAEFAKDGTRGVQQARRRRRTGCWHSRAKGQIMAQDGEMKAAKLCLTSANTSCRNRPCYTDELSRPTTISRRDRKRRIQASAHSINAPSLRYGRCSYQHGGGFLELIKRGIGGVYHAVSQKYLQTYLDEYIFPLQPTGSGQPDFQVDFGEVSKRAVE